VQKFARPAQSQLKKLKLAVRWQYRTENVFFAAVASRVAPPAA
jgi:hypothetical protein